MQIQLVSGSKNPGVSLGSPGGVRGGGGGAAGSKHRGVGADRLMNEGGLQHGGRFSATFSFSLRFGFGLKNSGVRTLRSHALISGKHLFTFLNIC